MSEATQVEPGEHAPEVSVVMLIHQDWDHGRRALEALREHTSVAFELIIVDNASDAVTRAQLAKLPDAQVLLNDRNEGFGPANNQGAAEARADLLVFLNADAYVTPGWLEPLREVLVDPGVAAVVPQYLHSDGSLQEAGVLLAQDGSVLIYGDGEDVSHPSYRFRRVVDYGSAACLMVRRRVFELLGGFDPVYAPAYYEDTELGLRIARLGMTVVYQPRSQVVHARYGSGSPEAATRLSERNRGTFRRRWAAELRGRPWTFRRQRPQAAVAARDAMATPRFLVLAQPSEPDLDSLLDSLRRGWPRSRVTWATEIEAPDVIVDRWLDQGVEVLAGRTWLRERLFHYDAVLAGVEIGSEISAAVSRTQPQAEYLRLADLGLGASPLDQLVPTLAAAGIAPP